MTKYEMWRDIVVCLMATAGTTLVLLWWFFLHSLDGISAMNKMYRERNG